jgi:hypothetical protein
LSVWEHKLSTPMHWTLICFLFDQLITLHLYIVLHISLILLNAGCNSKFISLRGLLSTVMKSEWKWNDKKATTKTITTQEIWHWHWIVSKKPTKHFYFYPTLFTVKMLKMSLILMRNTPPLMHEPLKTTSRSSRTWAL